MYARTVTVDLDVDRWEEILAFGASVKDQIAAFPGLTSWHLVANRTTGEGTSFAVFESQDAFDAVNSEVNAILADFGQFFTSPPRELLGDVLIAVGRRHCPPGATRPWASRCAVLGDQDAAGAAALLAAGIDNSALRLLHSDEPSCSRHTELASVTRG